MKITMKDIAKLSGTSQSTVSRVLNNDKRISKETFDKVKKVVDEVQFKPNVSAQKLVSGKTKTIGLVINVNNQEEFSNVFITRSIFAIEKRIQEQGYDLLLLNYDEKNREQFKELIFQNKVDGVILPSSLLSEQILLMLTESKTEFVLMGEPDINNSSITWADIDNLKSSEKAISFLSKYNLDNYLMIIEDKEKKFNKNRIKGFEEFSKKNKLSYKIIEEKKQGLEEIIINNCLNTSTGIIAGNNFIAQKIIKILNSNKIKIGNNIKLITFDNYPLAEYLIPPVTAIDIDTINLGTTVASYLLEKIETGTKNNYNAYISSSLILRESTGD